MALSQSDLVEIKKILDREPTDVEIGFDNVV